MRIDTKSIQRGGTVLSADDLMVVIAFASLLVEVLSFIVIIILSIMDKNK